MSLIWAARGRTWGFRFLRDAGFQDPLREYEKAFSGLEDEPETFRRVGEIVALRFHDPLGRQDLASRLISHDFVVFGDLATEINSVEDGVRDIWPLVSNDFARVWELRLPS